jgi:hypothetical protein
MNFLSTFFHFHFKTKKHFYWTISSFQEMSKTKIKIRHLEDLDTIHIIFVNHDWYKLKTKKNRTWKLFFENCTKLTQRACFRAFWEHNDKEIKIEENTFHIEDFFTEDSVILLSGKKGLETKNLQKNKLNYEAEISDPVKKKKKN